MSRATFRQQTKRSGTVRSQLVEYGQSRGVRAARRLVAPESYAVLDRIAKALKPVLRGAVITYSHSDYGVTVMSPYRFSNDHLKTGPRTNLVTEQIESARRPMEVELSRLAIFGKKFDPTRGRVIASLAIELDSMELEDESLRYEKEMANYGVPLRNYPGDGLYHPHCSIATLTKKISYLGDERTLTRLSSIAGIGPGDMRIVLDPVRYYPEFETRPYTPEDIASNGLAGVCRRQTAPVLPAFSGAVA